MNYKNNERENTIILISLIIILIFGSFIEFWSGYLVGWFAKIFIGKYIVEGFALIGITMPIDKIPLFTGVLTWFGNFFKVRNLNNN